MNLDFSEVRGWAVLLATIVTSIAGVAWQGADIKSKVTANTEAIIERTKDRYSKSEALSDLALRDQMIRTLSDKLVTVEASNKESLSEIKTSMNRMENKLDRYVFRRAIVEGHER